MKQKNKQRRKLKPPSIITPVIILCVLIAIQTLCYKNLFGKIYPEKYHEDVYINSKEFNVDPNLVLAVIKTESNFRSDAKSSANARGVMQLTPDTFDWLQTKMNDARNLSEEDLYNPSINIRYGTYFLSILLEEFESEREALCAYNAGRSKLKSWLKSDKYSSDGKNINSIPYPETREYVEKVLLNYQNYLKLYGGI